MKSKFIINGVEKTLEYDGYSLLVDVLRANGYTEIKEGCKTGECGACLVFIDDVLVNSCQVLAGSVAGKDIVTVKGLGSLFEPNVIQESFVDSGAVQCGFCTPGMIMAAYNLLRDNKDPDDQQIKSAMDGNLCRCTGYVKIIDAVKLAAERIRENGKI